MNAFKATDLFLFHYSNFFFASSNSNHAALSVSGYSLNFLLAASSGDSSVKSPLGIDHAPASLFSIILTQVHRLLHLTPAASLTREGSCVVRMWIDQVIRKATKGGEKKAPPLFQEGIKGW